MEFYTSYKDPRPVRCSEATRLFAYESLNHKYGLDTKKVENALLDHIEGISDMELFDQYDIAIEEIVKQAPIRICEGEKISGAATLGHAIRHLVPATIKTISLCSSVSHLTIDFESVLKNGVGVIREQILASMKKHTDPDRLRFLKSALHCMDCFTFWHGRYLDALKDRPGYEVNYENLKQVPFGTPRNFHEAVQSLWFVFAFVRLTGSWPGFGRIDYLLGDYLKKDLENGTLTMDEAREILAHFFIKGCEWIAGGNYTSGDAQHYQNIVLAGIDEDGNEVTNEVTYLVLDIIEEFGISDFPVTIRISDRTDPHLLRRAAEVIRHGGGVIALYNEDLVLRALTDYGYPLREARKFANDGCWEVQIPGKTQFTYVPFDALWVLQTRTLAQYDGSEHFDSFDALYARYRDELEKHVEWIYEDRRDSFVERDATTGEWKWKPVFPGTIVSLFEQGCIEKGQAYFEGGPVYNVCSPHIGGLPDAANSLYAIKKLVFDDKLVSFDELMTILANDWEGHEDLRRYAEEHYNYYGNDNDEVDLIAARILGDFADCCKALDGRCPIMFPSGVSTFGRQLDWVPFRFATPFGKKKGAVLAGNLSPTPGTDKEGATAIIKSYCKADLSRHATGAALDIRLLPGDVKDEEGIAALVGLMRGFIALGGFFMQIDVADAKVLLDAQEHPENYQTLSVRVSGWNARFVTMNRQWQDMIIQEMKRS